MKAKLKTLEAALHLVEAGHVFLLAVSGRSGRRLPSMTR